MNHSIAGMLDPADAKALTSALSLHLHETLSERMSANVQLLDLYFRALGLGCAGE